MSEEVIIHVHTDKDTENVIMGVEISIMDEDDGMIFPVRFSPLAAIDLGKKLKEAAVVVLQSDVSD